MKTRTLAISLLAILAFGGDASGQARLNRKLGSIRDSQAKLKRELRKTKYQQQWVAEDIDKVDQRIDIVQNQLEETTQDLNKSRSQQKRIAAELVQTETQLEKTKQQMRRRIRALYKNGEGSFLSVLVGSQNVGDLASRAYLVERIAEKDHDLFDRYTTLRTQIATRKRRQDHLVREIGRLAAFHRTKEGELRDAKEEKEDVLEGLKAKQGRLQQMIAQFEADERAIEGQIEAYMRRLAAQRARPPRKGDRPLPPVRFSGGFSRPINAPMTSTFGSRYHPILHVRRMHTGCDFGAPVGSTIMAAGDGVVIATSYMRGYGNTIIIDHGGGVSTVYAHTSRIYVSSGQSVRRGQRIAAVGSTGLSTGPHLHFEVRVNGRPVNPMSRL